MTEQQKSLTDKDPKAGCLIMLIGIVIFGGLITYTVTLPFRQAGLMGAFTQQESLTLPTKEVLAQPPQRLAQKLKVFNEQISSDSKEDVQLTLTKEDLNDAIRSYSEFKELQGTFAVNEILKDKMIIDISFPLKGKPFTEETPHLNGVMTATAEVMNDEIVLLAESIDSRVGEVPEGFLSHLQPYRVMAGYSEHPYIGKAMYACQKLSLVPGEIILSINPVKYIDPLAIAKEESNEKQQKKKMITTMICSFLMVSGFFYVVVKRRNANSAKRFGS